MEHFADRLTAAVRARGTPVMVGLDPRWENLPEILRRGRDPANLTEVAAAYRQFCEGVLEAVTPLVGVVKPQAAFFEALGPPGMAVLAEVMATARRGGLVVVLDAKRNDIGPTATAYAQGYLGAPPASPWGADALTVSPYLGSDSLAPFVEVGIQRGAGIFVLVKTSNPGGGLFQDLRADGRPVYEHVAAEVERWARETRGECGYGLVHAVVGATYPEQLAALRGQLRHSWILVPGFGAQGGAAKDVAAAFDEQGLGAVINNSRGIIFAYERSPYRDRFGPSQWQEAVAAATREMIEQLRSETPAGRLASPR